VRLPGPAGRIAVTGAAAVWAGTALGLHLGVIVIVPVLSVALALLLGRRTTLAIFVVLAAGGVLSGSMAASRIEATWDADVPEGPVTVIGRVAEDGRGSRPGIVVPDSLVVGEDPLPWAGPALAVGLAEGLELVAGERALIEGILRHAPGRVRGDPIAGRLAARRVERVGTAGPLFAVGNALRARVESATSGDGAGRALLSGFLIGDTSQLPARHLDALRRSGLTHFVAVSGSNVALFLAGWWMVTALFGIGSRRRFVLGLVGLAVFVVVARWEGSVLRAATMAGFLLGGSAAGVAVDGWMALGAAVAVLLLASGHLAVDVGFQLSVAATAGIMLGAAGRTPRWAWTVLAATLSAQLSVLPILLWHFGSVPLLSPLANLMAAPLVSAATVTGAVGVVIGWAPLVDAASRLAGLVLAISHLAAAWPQLGTGAVLLIAALGGLVAFRRLRPWLAVGAALALGAAMLGVGITPSGSTVTVVDIGQGDAVLLRSEGAVALVDGGRDPLLLAEKLRGHGVGRIDLLIVTHGDIDHVGGLDGIFGDHGVGRLWVPAHGDPGAALERLVAEAVAVGVIVERVDARSPPGTIGNITLRPMGPMRRYAADNDVSIVLWVEARRTLLLAGDVESVAQRELPALHPDVLLVPHHGSATTDIEWLAETLGETAVVSVGVNVYGHPATEIMTVLEELGVELFVTQTDGDVTIRLD
jgi:competence protein ComEC